MFAFETASLEVDNLVNLFQSSEVCEHRTHLPDRETLPFAKL